MILSKNKSVQRRRALDQVRLDALDAIPRAQQRLQARALREVGEGGEVVVGEIDGLLVAGGAEVLDGGDLVACSSREGGENESTGSLWFGCKCSAFCPFQGNRLGAGHTS